MPSNKTVQRTKKVFPLRKESQTFPEKFSTDYINFTFVKSLIFEPSRLPLVSLAVLAAELVLNVFIVQNVRYTEIDWIAYMQECEGFINGTTNYSMLTGDTGPLVYPAGFVYIYSALYFLTSRGSNIRLAQYIFIGIYLLQLTLVLRLYCKSRKIPPYVILVTIFTSYRIHSIYVLRLFNDPIAVLLLYAALNLYIDGRWTLGSVMFSLGVSVKMNILLFAPAVLLMFITNLGWFRTFIQLTVCSCIQILLGLPFLSTYPWEYIKGSFDFARVFDHKWTVNYRFLEPVIFESKMFHLGLLALHLALLVIFATPCLNYFQNYCRLRNLEIMLAPQIAAQNLIEEEKCTGKEKRSLSNRRSITDSAQKENSGSAQKLSEEEQQFLKSFEKTIKQASDLEEKKHLNQTRVKAPNIFSIHFDRCSQLALLPLFLSNFIGIVCARSLHYQFYVWYFHSLPYLMWYTEYENSFKFLMLLLIEFCWNTYPSTVLSSVTLHVCHVILLFGIGKKMFRRIPDLGQFNRVN
ncbi:lethal(2)neighbour of tid protein 2 [Anopheles bellator]|uniref:lethal(2)neighbour of tid protein 2 n=1 Tax=Anopheles bellator TaxID=139047 RepID=UPI00264768B5|nr:lethal(2)neighbour of tid protein 2 [Anopheles bellator]